VSVQIVHTCPACGGRVKITHIEVEVDTLRNEKRITYHGECEKCRSLYKLTKRLQLGWVEPPWHCKRPKLAMAW
jgi:rRNA maturation endonuclease Nob1